MRLCSALMTTRGDRALPMITLRPPDNGRPDVFALGVEFARALLTTLGICPVSVLEKAPLER